MQPPISSTGILDDYPDVMCIQDVQNALHIGRNSAYNLIRSEALRSVKIGKSIRILKKDLIDFLFRSEYNEFGSNGCFPNKEEKV